jgi:hypothetical protein
VSDSESSPDDLRQSLTRLHADLSVTTRVDETSRRLLRDLLGDIERLLRDDKAAAVANSSRLEALAVQFDSNHPALSASLREFVDLLGRAGL